MDNFKTYPKRNPSPKVWIRAVWLEEDGEEEGAIPSIWVDELANKVSWPVDSSSKSAARKWLPPTSKWLLFNLIKIKCRGDYETCENFDFQTTDTETSISLSPIHSQKQSSEILESLPGQSLSPNIHQPNGSNSGVIDMPDISIDRVSSTPATQKFSLKKSGIKRKTDNSSLLSEGAHNQASRKLPFIQNDDPPTNSNQGSIKKGSSNTLILSSGKDNVIAANAKDISSKKDTAEKKRSSNIDAFPISEGRFQRKVLYKLAQVVDILQDIQSRVAKGGGTAQVEITQLKNLDEFVELCNIIIEDVEAKKSLTEKLSQVGGDDLGDCTRATMRKLMTHELMSKFNMEGHGEKESFKKTLIYDCVLSAVRDVFRGESENNVSKEIMSTLKHAPARVKKK